MDLANRILRISNSFRFQFILIG